MNRLNWGKAATLMLLAGALSAQEAPTPEDRLAALEARQKTLEDKWQAAPQVVAGKEGFSVRSADNKFSLKLTGDLQMDGRFYLNDEAQAFTDGFLIRRARPTLDITGFGFVTARIQSNLAATASPYVDDAYIDVKPWTAAQFRFGRFKGPFGLENLQSSARTLFVERSLASDLVPNFDTGAALSGELGAGALTYAVAYMNGVADGGSTGADASDRKDTLARVFVLPFKSGGMKPLQDFGLGVAASFGGESGTNAASQLPSYKTEGQNTFFSYTNGVASGDRRRLSPQFYWYPGPISVMGEYVTASQALKSTTTLAAADPTQRAWQVSLGWVVTGEKSSYKGINPKTNFDPAAGTWGALELAGRYSQLEIHDDAFNGFADRAKSARLARAWTGGANWYLNGNTRAQVNYTYTGFDGGAPSGDRAPERALFTRLQFAF